MMFQGLCVSSAQIPVGEKEKICAVVDMMGGIYQHFVDSNVTHLILLETKGQKYQAACQLPSVKIVHAKWFNLCMERGYLVDESPFLLPRVVEQQPGDATKPGDQLPLVDLYNPLFKNSRFLLDTSMTGRIQATCSDIIERRGGSWAVSEKEGPFDFVISSRRDSAAWMFAESNRIPCVNHLWLVSCDKAGRRFWFYSRLAFMPGLSPIASFKNFVIALSGFREPERGDLASMITALGAAVTENMQKGKNTHLVTNSTDTEKYRYAAEWGVTTASYLWIDNCYFSWKCLDVVPYSKNIGEHLYRPLPVPQWFVEHHSHDKKPASSVGKRKPASVLPAQQAKAGVPELLDSKVLQTKTPTVKKSKVAAIATTRKDRVGKFEPSAGASEPEEEDVREIPSSDKRHKSVRERSKRKLGEEEEEEEEEEYEEYEEQEERSEEGDSDEEEDGAYAEEGENGRKGVSSASKSFATDHTVVENGRHAKSLAVPVSKRVRALTTAPQESSSPVEPAAKKRRMSGVSPRSLRQDEKTEDLLKGFEPNEKNRGWVFLFGGDEASQERMRKDISSAGGFALRTCHSYKPECTHVILSELSRTDKLFCACAAGKWVLMRKYVDACKRSRALLAPDEYEFHGDKTIQMTSTKKLLWQGTCRRWRLYRAELGHGPFHGWRISCSGIEENLRKALERMIIEGDGVVVPVDEAANLTHVFAPSRALIPPHIIRRVANETPLLLPDYAFDYICLQYAPETTDPAYQCR
eukprot:ANDGO_03820.mRNA.2 BRCT domain-containing protein At4g02110